MASQANKTDLITTAETAAMIGASKATLDSWRCRGSHGLRFIKVGSKVFYRRSDVEAWLASRSGTSCAEISAAIESSPVAMAARGA